MSIITRISALERQIQVLKNSGGSQSKIDELKRKLEALKLKEKSSGKQPIRDGNDDLDD